MGWFVALGIARNWDLCASAGWASADGPFWSPLHTWAVAQQSWLWGNLGGPVGRKGFNSLLKIHGEVGLLIQFGGVFFQMKVAQNHGFRNKMKDFFHLDYPYIRQESSIDWWTMLRWMGWSWTRMASLWKLLEHHICGRMLHAHYGYLWLTHRYP